MPTPLPHGWDLDRVRSESGNANSRLLETSDRHVVLATGNDYVDLNPTVIIDFSNLCLVAVGPDWYMGSLEPDGSIICWGSYGTDLGEAIKAM